MNFFKNFGQNIKVSFGAMKNATDESVNNIKEMKDEFSQMDFKKMPKKGMFYIALSIALLIGFMVLAWFNTR